MQFLLCPLFLVAATAVATPVRVEVGVGASLADVRDSVRALSPDDRARGVEVVLAPGEYVLPEGLDFAPADGGVSPEAPIVWRAATPGAVRIVGARRIAPESFHRVDNAALLARLPEEGRGRVWTAPLDPQGWPGSVRAVAAATEVGPPAIPPLPGSQGGPGSVRAVAAATEVGPPAIPPLSGSQGGPGSVRAASAATEVGPPAVSPLPDVFEDVPPPTVFFGDIPGHLAAWPNGNDWASFTEGVDRGTPVKVGDHTLWRNGAFIWSHPRASRWDFSRGVWLNGYFTHDWRNCTARVGSYGREGDRDNVMRIAADIPYGVLGGTWGRKERRFRAVNLFEELDEPLEWWIDHERGVLYFVPTDGAMDIRVAVSTKPLLRGAGVMNLRFEGIAFACNHGPFVSFASPRGVSFRNCSFIGTASDAIVLSGDARDTMVADCEIAHCGAGGIRLSGGDRRSLTSSGSTIERCRIHDFGIFRRTYAGGVRLEGCGHVLRGCELWDAPHTAVFWEGNDMLLESNDVHHVLLETGDAGAFYTGRDWTTQGNVLRGNFVHDIGGGTTAAEGADAAVSGTNAMGFYFDDCDCGDEVVGNRFLNVPRAIMIGGGRDHPIRGNVFENCRLAISIDCRGITWGDKWKTPDGENLLAEKARALGYDGGVWAERYPRLARILDDHSGEPLYNPIEENVFNGCSSVLAIGDAFRLDRDGTAPGLASRLAPIRDNVVIDPPDGPPTQIALEVSSGFRRIRCEVPESNREPSKAVECNRANAIDGNR